MSSAPVAARTTASWRRTLPLAGTVVGCVALFAVTYWASVRTVEGRVLSDAALEGALASNGPVSDTVDAVLNVVSVGSLLAAMAVVALIALLRLRRVHGLAAVGVLITSNVSTLLLKDYLLARPDLGVDEVGPATLNSLPSGHATAAFSAVAALLLVVPRRLRSVVAFGGAAYAAVTGLATMSAGWHRAADAVAAYLVVGAWTALAALVVVLREPSESGQGAARPGVRWPVAIALGCVLVGGVLALALAAAPALLDSTIGPPLAFGSGVLLVLGAALGVGAVLRVVVALME